MHRASSVVIDADLNKLHSVVVVVSILQQQWFIHLQYRKAESCVCSSYVGTEYRSFSNYNVVFLSLLLLPCKSHG